MYDEPYGYDTDGDGFIDTDDRGSFFGYDFDGDGDIDADDDFYGFMMIEEADFCFIATAVYGDLNHPQVVTLRRFRDQVLRKSTGGRFFIRWYYQNGLEIARVMQGKNLMVKCCRILLDCFVRLINSLTNHS